MTLCDDEITGWRACRSPHWRGRSTRPGRHRPAAKPRARLDASCAPPVFPSDDVYAAAAAPKVSAVARTCCPLLMAAPGRPGWHSGSAGCAADRRRGPASPHDANPVVHRQRNAGVLIKGWESMAAAEYGRLSIAATAVARRKTSGGPASRAGVGLIVIRVIAGDNPTTRVELVRKAALLARMATQRPTTADSRPRRSRSHRANQRPAHPEPLRFQQQGRQAPGCGASTAQAWWSRPRCLQIAPFQNRRRAPGCRLPL